MSNPQKNTGSKPKKAKADTSAQKSPEQKPPEQKPAKQKPPKQKPPKTWSTPVKGEPKISVPCAICGGELFAPHFKNNGSNPLFAPDSGPDMELVFFAYVHCVRCGLVQINPQPDSEAVAFRYNKNHGDDYLKYELANEKVFLRLQELALKDAGFYLLEQKLLPPNVRAGLAGAGEAPRVLDIGCATGALLASLQNSGWNARGVEISGPQAAYCRKQGLDVSALPLEENHFPDSTFDVVLASHVIEHLNSPFGFALEVKRVLKPGGHFFVTTPNISGFQAQHFGSAWRSAIFDHLYLFSQKTLRMLLEKAGFGIERVKTWGGLAEGSAPPLRKKIMDRLAKPFAFGDVMIVRAIAK